MTKFQKNDKVQSKATGKRAIIVGDAGGLKVWICWDGEKRTLLFRRDALQLFEASK